LFALLLSVPSALKAQTALASLEGLITDSSGAVVPGAAVELVNEATGVKLTMKSDQRGYYLFTLLQPSSYRLTVTMPGFEMFVRSAMALQIQQNARVDVALKPGAVSTKVEVTGEAPRLDTVSATQGQVISSNEMSDLPGGIGTGRGPLQFLELTPTVVGGGGNIGAGLTASFNGSRLGTTDVLMDGVTILSQDPNAGMFDQRYSPTLDIVQEMKVQTNQFSAEYGLTGGAVVTMVTRSGSNMIHGDAYEFNQTQHFSANSWFLNAGGYGNSVKPVSRLNDFGFVVGGPVYLPKVYDGRNKSFFFYHWEKVAKGSAQYTVLQTVPTAAADTGDFSAVENSAGVPVNIYNPSTYNPTTGLRTQYPGNIINPTTTPWDPVGKKVISFLPAPTGLGSTPADLNNFYYLMPLQSPWYQEDFKFDENITANQRISFRFSRTPSEATPGGNAWGAGNYMTPYTSNYSASTTRPVQSTATYTNVINPTTILNIQGGVNRYYSSSGALGEPSNWQAQSWGYANNLGLTRPPVYWLDEYTTIGPDVWEGNLGTNFVADTIDQIAATLTKVKGKHTFKFGFEQRFSYNNQAGPGMTTGGFDVDAFGTRQNPTVPPTTGNQGDALATLMAGWGGNESMGNGASLGGYVGTSLGIAAGSRQSGLFAQDDFRVTSKLTLNLGLRWDVNWPYSERWNRIDSIDPYMASPLNTYFAGEGLTTLLQGGYVYASPDHRHVYDTDLHDFAPRIGFAYQFHPKWVARGGYGLFYGISVDQIDNIVAPGYAATTAYNWSANGGATLTNPFDNPFPNGNVPVTGSGLGAAENLGNSLSGPVPDYNLSARVEQWSFSIERELPGNSVLEIGYSGVHAYHLGEGSATGLLGAMPVSALSYGCLLNSCSGHLNDGTVVTGGSVANPYYGALNVMAPGSSQDVPTIPTYQYLSPYPQYSGVSAAPGPPMGKSYYDAGFVRFTRRMAKGLQFTAHYTWSKSLDNSTTANDGADDSINCITNNCIQNNTGIFIQDWGNLMQEKAVSLNDVTNRLVSDGVWDLPFGRGRTLGSHWNRALDAVAGGWKTSGVLTIQSGAPIVAHLAGGGDLGDGSGFDQRPNLSGNPVTKGSVESRLGDYLNANAFSAPAPYTFGTAPRTLSGARAPGWRELDMDIFKSFYFTGDQTRYLEFRVQVTNVPNHPLFSYPNSVVNGGSFGAITSTMNSPRSALASLKLYF
jgi:hypothetical protein